MNAVSGSGGSGVASVVINYNGGERILRCLEALQRQRCRLDRMVVVDNGSEDGSPEEIRRRFPEVDVIEMGGNLGLPAARNAGLRAVDSEFVLLVDSDIYPEPDALDLLLESRRETDATVACPRIRLIPERGIVQADGASPHFIGTMTLLDAYRPVDELPTDRRIVPGCIGACYLLHRARVLEAGGFDEEFFFYFEDLEFMLRLAARGHHFVCEPAALVYHERGIGTPGLSFRGEGSYPPRRAYLSMRNRWLTMLLHYHARTLLVLSPALALYEMAVLALAARQGWLRQWGRAWGWHLRNRRRLARMRRSHQDARVRPDRDLLTGGALPLAPGVADSGPAKHAVAVLSTVLNGYWRLVRPLLG